MDTVIKKRYLVRLVSYLQTFCQLQGLYNTSCSKRVIEYCDVIRTPDDNRYTYKARYIKMMIKLDCV
jgi:hypothetical protein